MNAKYPETAKMFADLKKFQDSLIRSIKVEKEEGSLKLSALSTLENDDEIEKDKLMTRETRITALNQMERERFFIQKRKLEAAFKNDCETYALVTNRLIAKDGSLEQALRLSFIENIDDLEKQLMDKIDRLLDRICG